MTRNKKKLRKAARCSGMTRMARTLALAGLLAVGTGGSAQALTIELNTGPIWNVVNSLLSLLAPADITMTGGGPNNTVSTSGNYLLGNLGSLTIAGNGSSKAVLNIASDLTITDGLLSNGLVNIGGSGGNQGILNVTLGHTLTSGGLVSINTGGLLDVSGALTAQKGVSINTNGLLSLRTGSTLNLGAASNLVLNGGTLQFCGTDGITPANGIINNLYLLKSGYLVADKLSFLGFNNFAGVAANGGALNVTANLLDLAGLQLNIGNNTTAHNTTVTIKGALPGQTIPEFLGGDVLVSGNSGQQTLQLGASGYTGNSNSAYSITLQGGNGALAAANKALLNVDYGKFSVANVTVGSSTGGYAGTVTVNNSGSLTVNNTLSINGGLSKSGKVTFGPNGSNVVKAKNIVVGGPTSYGELDLETNAGTVIVDTALGGSLTVGANGQVNVNNADSILEFTGDWTLAESSLATNSSPTNGKIMLKNGKLLVDGTLHTSGAVTARSGNTLIGTDITVGALDASGGTLTLNAGKTTTILGLNNGNLLQGTVTVKGTNNNTDTLTIGQIGTSMSAGALNQGVIQLQGKAGKAVLNVVGNGAANSIYQLQSILAGGENAGSASATTGTINVDGATLKAGNITLLGMNSAAAALNIGALTAADVMVGTLTVGNATDKGNISLKNGSTLTADTMSFHTDNGGIFVDAASKLNLTGNTTLAGVDLAKGTMLQSGQVTLNTGASLNVAEGLTLTGAGPMTIDVTGAAVNAKTLSAMNGVNPEALTWNGGNLTLYGAGAATSFLNASQLNVSNGIVQLGAPDMAVGSKTLTTLGGTYAGPVDVSGSGKLNVTQGTWTLSDTSSGLTVSAAGGLNVVDSFLSVGKLTTTGSGSADVGTGPGIGKLTVTGTGLATTGGSINVRSNGIFEAGYNVVTNGTGLQAGVGIFDVDLGGTLVLQGTGTISQTDYNILKGNILNGNGVLQLVGITITPTGGTRLTDVLGTYMPDLVAQVSNNDTVNLSTTVKGLKGDPYNTADIGVTVSTGELRLVGDVSSSSNFQFADNGAFNTNFTVGANGLLTLGNAAGTAPTYGTLTGNVILSTGGGLNAVNGIFTTGAVSGNGDVNVSYADLTVESLNLGTPSVITVNQNGSLLADNDSTVYNLTLDHGTFKTANGKDLTVNGTLSMVNQSLLHVGKDLTLANDLATATDSTIKVLGNLNATGKNIAGGNLDLTVGGTLSAANLTADNGSMFHMDILAATGLTTVDHASTLTADGMLTTVGLTVDNGSTVTANGSANTGVLSIGSTASPSAASTMTVAGNLASAALNLNNGSTLSVTGTTNATGAATVDNASILTATGNLTTAGLTVDHGSIVTAKADADTGALSIGPNAASSMTVAGNLASATLNLNNGSTLSVTGTTNATGAATVDNASTLTATGNLTTAGLTVDNGSTVTAKADATVDGNLSIGATAAAAKSTMTVAQALNVTGTTTLDHASTLDVTSGFTSAGTTVDNGAILTVGGNADTGAIAIGQTVTASMNVTGNLTATTATLDTGSTLTVAGDMTATDAASVDNGAVLTTGTLTLAGAGPASLTVGATAASSVKTGTLNVGDATQQGRLTIANGSVDTNLLNNTANGGILIQVGGALNVNSDLTVTGQDLIGATTLTQGKIALDGGSLNIAGNLGLTGSGSVASGLNGGSGTVRAVTVSAMDGSAATDLTWNGGELALFGDGSTFANATSLAITAGYIRLGANDRTVGSTALTTKGGSFAGPVNVSGTGGLTVFKGDWTLSGPLNVTAPHDPVLGGGLIVGGGSLTTDTVALTGSGAITMTDGVMTANQVNLSNSASLVLSGGTLTTVALTTTNTATAAIGGGTSLAALNLTGGAGSLTSAANTIDILNNGRFNAIFSTVASGTGPAGGVKQFAVNTGGVLALTGLTTISLSDYQTLRGNLINGSGLLDLVGTTITGVDPNTKLTNVLGTSLPDNVVLVSDGDGVNMSTTVKGVKGDPYGTGPIDLSVSNGELRLVGDKTDQNFALSDNGNQPTNIAVGQNGSLALGDPTGTAPTYGILNGNITLDGQLKADNGTFTVGDVTGQANATAVTVNNATLNTGALDLTASTNSVVTVNNGALNASKDSTVWTVSLNNGALTTTGTADLTVKGPATLVNGSTLAAGGDLTFTGLNPGDTVLTGKDSTVTAGGNLDATGRNIVGDNLDITAGGAFTVANLSGVNGSQYKADSLHATGDVTLDSGSSLVTTKDAAVDGKLSLGPTAAAQMTVGGDLAVGGTATLDHGSMLGVTGDMDATGVTTLDNGSKANVGGTLTTDAALAVQNQSMLATGALDAKASVIVDSGSVLTTAHNATVAVSLSIGATSAAQMNVGGNLSTVITALDHGSILNVTGGMTATGATSLNNGSTANVGGTLTAGGTVSVLEGSTLHAGVLNTGGHDVVVGSANGQGGTLTTGELNTSGGGHLLIDPVSGTSFAGADKLTNNQLSAMTVVGNGGILSLGSSDRQRANTLIAASGVTPASTLLVSSPMTMTGTGQLLVGEKYRKDAGFEGVWDANATPDTYALTLRGNSLLVADMGKTPAGGALITVGAPTGSVTPQVLMESTAAVRLNVDSGLKSNTTYTLVGGLGANSVFQQQGGTAIADGQTLTLNGGLSTNNLLITLSGLTYHAGTGTLDATTSAKQSTTVLPGLSGGMGGLLDGLAAAGLDVNHPSAGARFLSRATDSRYISGVSEAGRTIEGAARISAAGAVQGMTLSMADAAVSAVESRINGLAHRHNKAMGISSGDNGEWVADDGTLRPGIGLWFTPIYRSENVHGMKAEGFKTGYKGDLGGASVGVDYTTVTEEHAVRVGAALNVGGGSAHSTGDFQRTNNDFSFWGVNLYGKWNYGGYGLRGNLGYISSDNSLKQNLPSSLGMDKLKSKVDSNAFTAGLTAEYRFLTSVANVMPYAGVRYSRLNTPGHDTRSGGETVFRTSRDNQDIVSFPVGVAIDKTWTTGSGWLVKPTLDLGVITAVGDIDAHHRVSATGVAGIATLKTRVVDRVTFSGELGLQVKKDLLTLGVDYNILASQHRTGHGASLSLRLEF